MHVESICGVNLFPGTYLIASLDIFNNLIFVVEAWNVLYEVRIEFLKFCKIPRYISRPAYGIPDVKECV